MNAFIRLLYSLLIAVATVTFVGVGIFSFYQPPQQPDYPDYPVAGQYLEYGDPGYDEQQKELDSYNDKQNKLYDEQQDKEKAYHRNVAFIVLPITAVLLAVGVVFLKRADVVGEGIALGGIATAVYGIIVSSMADHRTLRFAAVTLFLAGAIVLGHRRFISEKK